MFGAGKLLLPAKTGIQFVGANTVEDNGANFTVPLTGLTGGIASAPAAGDYVIVALSSVSNGDLTMGGPGTGGWTDLAELASPDTVYANLMVTAKVMGSSPDTTVGVGNSASGTRQIAGIYVLRGVDPTTPLDVSVVTATGNNTDRANPGSITPTTPGAFIMAIGAGGSNSTHTTNLAQSEAELSHFVADYEQATIGSWTSLIAMGIVPWTSGAFNPAAFVGGDNGAGSAWAAVTLAVRPA